MSTMDGERRTSSSCLKSYKFQTIQLSALDAQTLLPVCALILTQKFSTVTSSTPRNSYMPVTTLSHKDQFSLLTFPIYSLRIIQAEGCF